MYSQRVGRKSVKSSLSYPGTRISLVRYCKAPRVEDIGPECALCRVVPSTAQQQARKSGVRNRKRIPYIVINPSPSRTCPILRDHLVAVSTACERREKTLRGEEERSDEMRGKAGRNERSNEEQQAGKVATYLRLYRRLRRRNPVDALSVPALPVVLTRTRGARLHGRLLRQC